MRKKWTITAAAVACFAAAIAIVLWPKDRVYGWEFERDDAGLVSKITDPAGHVTHITHEYDEAKGEGRLTKVCHDGSTVTFTFDKHGRRTARDDSLVGHTDYKYSDLAQLVHVGHKFAPTISYEYDAQRRVRSVKVGNLGVDYDYDFLGRLTVITTPAGKITYEHRPKDGQIIRRLPNGVVTAWQYHPSGRLETLTHRDSTGDRVAQFTYEYHAGGLLKSIKEATPDGVRERTFEYDVARRLTRVTDSKLGDFEYKYDQLGNRVEEKSGGTSRPSTFDWSSQLATHDGKSCDHDPMGNLTRYVDRDDRRDFDYNVQGWLTGSKLKGTSAARVAYKYDGEGNLVRREAGEDKADYVPDPVSEHWRPLLATDAVGAKTLFVWDGTTCLAAFRDGKAQFFLHDHQGSVTTRLDEAGKPQKQVRYAPFGEPVNSADAGLQPGFKGLFFDPQTGLYVERRRTYDPNLGRFLQRNPARNQPFAQGRPDSPYIASGANPANPDDGIVATPGAEAVEPPLPEKLLEIVLEIDGSSIAQQNSITTDPSATGGDTSSPKQTVSGFFGAVGDIAKSALDAARQGVGNALQSIGSEIRNIPGTGKIEYGKSVEEGIPGVAKNTDTVKIEMDQKFIGGAIEALGNLIAPPQKPAPNPESAGSDDGSNGTPPAIGPGGGSPVPDSSDSGGGYVPSGAPAPSVGQQIKDALDGNWTPPPINDPDVSYSYRKKYQKPPPKSNYSTAIPDSGSGGANSSSKPASGTASTTKPPMSLQSYLNGPGSLTGKGASYGYKQPDGTIKWADGTVTTGDRTGYLVMDEKAKKGSATITYDESRPKGQSVNSTSGTKFFGTGGNPSGAGLGASSNPPTTATNVSGVGSGGSSASAGGGGRPPAAPKVGGIALRGAGQALAALGPLQGIAVDHNGRLVLIGKGKGEIGLPPLRLDDVVTVFRCVYIHGDSPSVSIDPIPGNPKGPLQRVRHGKGTANTYVGWVLFEADRLMKSYNLRQDNVTKRPVTSAVAGYDRLLDLRFGIPAGDASKWSRFWFVPAKTDRLQARDTQLTLFHVPLKIRTETEIERDGKLHPAPDVEPTAYAKAFSAWFTDNYEALAREMYSVPPPESGMTTKVAVLKELQRITLIAAIAESLRDQGVPMPGWMMDYPVRPCPVPETTPSLTASYKRKVDNGTETVSIFGGVTLSAPKDTIKTQVGAPQAERVAPMLQTAVADAPLFAATKFTDQDNEFQVVALPGNDTRVLGGLGLQDTDLNVPVTSDRRLSLTRQFHSFFQPADFFGQGWTLDLPELKKQRLITERTEKQSMSRPVYQLVSPLGTWNESFTEYGEVKDIPAKVMIPRSNSGIACLFPTKEGTVAVMFRDGRYWYFNDQGQLVRVEQTPFAVHYRWDKQRLTQIEAHVGKEKKAHIRLTYDGKGRVEAAEGSNGVTIQYSYDDQDQLTTVNRPGERPFYTYTDGQITEIARRRPAEYLYKGEQLLSVILGPPSLVQFKYNKDGQLTWQRDALGREQFFSYEQDKKGQRVSVKSSAESGSPADQVQYDASLRPISRTLADGTKMQWRYGEGGSATMTVAGPRGEWEVKRARDGGQQTVAKLPDGTETRIAQDVAGRVLRVQQNGLTLVEREYRSDGLLIKASTTDSEIFPKYAANGQLEGVAVRSKKADQNGYAVWMKLKYDSNGRPVEIADQSELKLQVAYDPAGRISGVSSDRSWVKVDRKADKVTVKTSWGQVQTTELKDGVPARTAIKEGDRETVVEFDRGLPTRIKQFNGGEVNIDYYNDGPGQGRPKEVRTADDLRVGYQFNSDGRLTDVSCGAIVRRVYTYDKNGRITGYTEVAAR